MQAITFIVWSFDLVRMTVDNYFIVMLVRDVVNVYVRLVLVISFPVLEMLDHPDYKWR